MKDEDHNSQPFIVHPSSFIVRLERETGLEPATATLATWNSTTELLPQRTKSEVRKSKIRVRGRFQG
jgi:hypothetical protein